MAGFRPGDKPYLFFGDPPCYLPPPPSPFLPSFIPHSPHPDPPPVEGLTASGSAMPWLAHRNLTPPSPQSSSRRRLDRFRQHLRDVLLFPLRTVSADDGVSSIAAILPPWDPPFMMRPSLCVFLLSLSLCFLFCLSLPLFSPFLCLSASLSCSLCLSRPLCLSLCSSLSRSGYLPLASLWAGSLIITVFTGCTTRWPRSLPITHSHPPSLPPSPFPLSPSHPPALPPFRTLQYPLTTLVPPSYHQPLCNRPRTALVPPLVPPIVPPLYRPRTALPQTRCTTRWPQSRSSSSPSSP